MYDRKHGVMFQLLDKEKVFISGGIWGLENTAVKSWYIFNISTKEIFKKADMNSRRELHGLIKYDQKVFAFGSFGTNKSAERYDIIRNSWKNLPDMPTTGFYISWLRLQN